MRLSTVGPRSAGNKNWCLRPGRRRKNSAEIKQDARCRYKERRGVDAARAPRAAPLVPRTPPSEWGLSARYRASPWLSTRLGCPRAGPASGPMRYCRCQHHWRVGSKRNTALQHSTVCSAGVSGRRTCLEDLDILWQPLRVDDRSVVQIVLVLKSCCRRGHRGSRDGRPVRPSRDEKPRRPARTLLRKGRRGGELPDRLGRGGGLEDVSEKRSSDSALGEHPPQPGSCRRTLSASDDAASRAPPCQQFGLVPFPA